MAAVFTVLVLLSSVLPLRSVLLGGIPFWHDPARDMLLAWGNLHKLTLIGPPGGIPGIFYGPYWIWLLSWPMVFTRDPRFIVLLAITIPSLILFPLILWKMHDRFGVPAVFIIWILFICNFESYLTFPWSPSPAALVFLGLAYLIAVDAPVIFWGIASALVPNFNFSFGLTVVFATGVYVLATKFRRLPHFLAGVGVVYLPLIIFELRHNFLQLRAFFDAFIQSVFYHRAVVGQIGMTKGEILSYLGSIPTQILHLPANFAAPLFVAAVFLILVKGLWRDRLIQFLTISLVSMVSIYMVTKNPVWPYYFIGTETIFLIVLGLIMAKSKVVTVVVGLFSLGLFVSAAVNFWQTFPPKYLTVPSLISKETITRFVITDAGQKPYQVFAYSPAIFTYDYDYLFSWLGKENNPDANLVYLIIPADTKTAVKEDFVHYKTGDKGFVTVEEKNFLDGTTVIKRLRTI